MQTFTPNDKAYTLLLGEIGHDSPERGVPGDAAAIDDSESMQDLTTTYITTMYYSALSNLHLQGHLPENMADIDNEMPRFKIVYNRTYADFTVAAQWLSKNGRFIETSPAKQYYDEVRAIESSVIDIPTAYAQGK
jgi:hypothetical protein